MDRPNCEFDDIGDDRSPLERLRDTYADFDAISMDGGDVLLVGASSVTPKVIFDAVMKIMEIRERLVERWDSELYKELLDEQSIIAICIENSVKAHAGIK